MPKFYSQVMWKYRKNWAGLSKINPFTYNIEVSNFELCLNVANLLPMRVVNTRNRTSTTSTKW